jgi:hypothetical protein
MMAKAAAATSVPATTHVGKGVITKPPTAGVEAMRRSTTDAIDRRNFDGRWIANNFEPSD